MAIKELHLSEIICDAEILIAARCEGMNISVVGEYAAAMERGCEFPPVKVVDDGKTKWLYCGFHRVAARRETSLDTIQAEVFKGTRDDACWLALGTNVDHGLRRTNEQKRLAVESALKMRPHESDRAIAEHVGVHQTTVSRTRKEMESTYALHKSESRLGRDGRTINTENIGKRSEPEDVPIFEDGDNIEWIEGDDPVDTVSLHVLQQLENEAADRGDYEAAAEYREEKFEVAAALEEQEKPKHFITLDEWKALSKSEQRECLAADYQNKTTLNKQDTDSIEWAKWSWNPVTGCKHDCPYCYARDIANRFYEQKFEPSIWPDRLKKPHNTKVPADAKDDIGLKNVFCCSMSDLFGRWVPKEWIEAVLTEVRAAPQWNFLFLTKFPKRMAEFEYPENAWLGTTVDCQSRVESAEEAFRRIECGVKWLSCEPLIEPLKFTSLSMFDWIVIGGSSASSQTPEWHPPRPWIDTLEASARKADCQIYEKSNLFGRTRQYPGSTQGEPPKVAPDVFHYLGKTK